MNNKKNDFKSFKPSNRLALIAVIGLVALFLMFMFNKPKESYQEIDYSNFVRFVQEGRVQKLRIVEKDIYGYISGGDSPLITFHK